MREIFSIGLIDEATIFLQTVIFLIVWTICLSALVFISWKRRQENSGLALIYTISLALIHYVIDLVYLINPKQFASDKWMFYGFRESTYGILFFTIGNLIVAPFFLKIFNLPAVSPEDIKLVVQEDQKIFAKRYFNIGLIAYFILPIFIFNIPTVRSLICAAQQLLVVGVCVICWIAWRDNDRKKLRRWILIAFCFPVLSVLVQGYLGFGTTMTLVILFFIVRFFKFRIRTFIIGLILAYLSLSLYLSYMRDRESIRQAVWNEKSFISRIEASKNVVLSPEWFNPFNLQHMETIDSRLNQNYLVGASVENLELGRVEFANGKTIFNTIYALMPRIIWKEKFLVAGATEIVIQYTGIQFLENTSVGIGQVMELYINFGRSGIIIGFLILGIFIAFIDRKSGYHLNKANIYKFVMWFLPGLAIITGGASFAEIAASTGANIIIARLVTSRYNNLLYFFLIVYVVFSIANKMIGG